MMTVEKILLNSGIDFKVIDEEDDYSILKVANKLNLLQLTSKNDMFLLDRDLFDYLDFNQLPYALLLLNTEKERWYFLQLRKKSNWIKSSFASCDKQEIFLGKQVLNSKVRVEEIGNKIMRMG